jgi:hypothetical protein
VPAVGPTAAASQPVVGGCSGKAGGGDGARAAGAAGDGAEWEARIRASFGLVRFRGIQSGRNNKCMKNIMIWTQIYSGSKINLPIMIGRTRDCRVGLVPHLLTSGLIPSLLVYLS